MSQTVCLIAEGQGVDMREVVMSDIAIKDNGASFSVVKDRFGAAFGKTFNGENVFAFIKSLWPESIVNDVRGLVAQRRGQQRRK